MCKLIVFDSFSGYFYSEGHGPRKSYISQLILAKRTEALLCFWCACCAFLNYSRALLVPYSEVFSCVNIHTNPLFLSSAVHHSISPLVYILHLGAKYIYQRRYGVMNSANFFHEAVCVSTVVSMLKHCYDKLYYSFPGVTYVTHVPTIMADIEYMTPDGAIYPLLFIYVSSIITDPHLIYDCQQLLLQ